MDNTKRNLNQLLLEASQLFEEQMALKTKYKNEKKALRQAARPQGKGRKKGKK